MNTNFIKFMEYAKELGGMKKPLMRGDLILRPAHMIYVEQNEEINCIVTDYEINFLYHLAANKSAFLYHLCAKSVTLYHLSANKAAILYHLCAKSAVLYHLCANKILIIEISKYIF